MNLTSKVKNLFVTKNGWSTEPSERMSYYSYFAGQNMIYTLFNVCLTTYLLFLGIDPIKSATVMLVVKVWDAVNDPMVGTFMDVMFAKSKNKANKFRPWILRSIPIMSIGMISLFTLPTMFDGLLCIVVLFVS